MSHFINIHILCYQIQFTSFHNSRHTFYMKRVYVTETCECMKFDRNVNVAVGCAHCALQV